MRITRTALLGLLTLAACAGCATASFSGDGSGQASPPIGDRSQNCAGWYDRAAGVCDTGGP